ncbi:MAG: CAP domain-containing protein [Bacteroidales bacterium]|jgi:uncharacterized protein YkwD|nr:CAP domain-containing protein [Bacteroidales bacterium]
MKRRKLLFVSCLAICAFVLFSGLYYQNKNYAKAPVTLNKTELLRLVNQARKSGCHCDGVYYPPVKEVVWNNKLETAAKNHCVDMQKHNFFSHKSSNGGTIVGRLNKVDYNWLAFGENIALGFKTEKEVVNSWLKSPTHCKTIMCGDFTEMGIAASDIYWVQVFGKPK